VEGLEGGVKVSGGRVKGSGGSVKGSGVGVKGLQVGLEVDLYARGLQRHLQPGKRP
jgi:hypothetical protein